MDIARILNQIRPMSSWSLDGDDYENLIWNGPEEKPSYEELVEANVHLKEKFKKEKVANLRRRAYQEESDPLFFEYQRGSIEKSVWLEKVEEIRQRYSFTASSQ
jgi:hypothetical protein